VFTHVAINSLAISKNKESNSEPLKYNIEVSIEEIENKEDKNKLKYVIVLLSEPKNVRLAVEGTVDISGDQSERTKILEKDENNVPRLLHLIYEELFPVFFMSTKTIGVPCPAYRLSQISEPSEIDESPITEEQENVSTVPEQPVTPEQPTATPEVEATRSRSYTRTANSYTRSRSYTRTANSYTRSRSYTRTANSYTRSRSYTRTANSYTRSRSYNRIS